MTTQFGEVEILIQGEIFPEGIVLREVENNMVVLEQYLDYTGTNVDVLHTFSETCLSDKEEFMKCLAIAREYLGDAKQPIYIVAKSKPIIDQKEAPKRQNRKICLNCTVEASAIRPWSFGPNSKKCNLCDKIIK